MNFRPKAFIKKLGNKTIIIHLFCWAVFIGYELALVYYSYGKLDPIHIYIYFYSFNIIYFYLHVRTLNFTFKNKTHYLRGSLLVLLLFICSMLIKFLSSYYFSNTGSDLLDQQKDVKTVLLSNLFRTGYFATLATFYWAADHIGFYRKESLEAEKKQLLIQREKTAVEIRLAETRNAYLQQQLNPHVLFNTLNFIYNSVYQHSPEASRSVVLLSDIMRYSLDATDTDGKTLLSKELEQIQNLIEINRQRYNHKLFLEVKITGDPGGHRMIPLILFTLTENIFKHGNLKNKDHPATLHISIESQNELRYYSSNLKKTPGSFTRISSIGIQNIRIRMDFAYSGKYRLDITDSVELFETTLTVKL